MKAERRCCKCRKMYVNDKWIVAKPKGNNVSDTWCDDCYKIVSAEIDKMKRARGLK